jgi:hypothetical protein
MKKQLTDVKAAGGRFDPFRLLSPEERRRHLDAYRSYLEVRNGDIDLDNRRLSRRETYLSALERSPLSAQVKVDEAAFREHLEGPGVTPIDEATAWLVAVANANEGEAYGVDLELRRFIRDKRFLRDERCIEDDEDGIDMLQLYVFLEEIYHSRILSEVCSACGHDLVIREPRWRIRLLSRAIYHAPDRLRWTVILCAEIVGVTAFKLFLDRCHLFASQPDVEERLRSLVTEIWQDELLHVAMLRARLGPWSLRIARRLFPFVVRSLIRDVPELLDLGGNRGEFMRRISAGIEVPPHIDWLHPDTLPPARQSTASTVIRRRRGWSTSARR